MQGVPVCFLYVLCFLAFSLRNINIILDPGQEIAGKKEGCLLRVNIL